MKNFFKFVFSGILLMILVMPILIQAETTVPNPSPGTIVTNPPATGPIKITNPFKGDNIRDLIRSIVNDILLPVGSVVAAVMIIYAGFLYVTAAGDPGQIKKAHDALLWAVIGAAILLGAWAISQAIEGTIKTLQKP